jgi:hypothetical protein
MGGIFMKHLTVGIAVVSIIVLCMYYKIVKVRVNFNLLSKNIANIAVWIARLMLGAIIVSWLR